MYSQLSTPKRSDSRLRYDPEQNRFLTRLEIPKARTLIRDVDNVCTERTDISFGKCEPDTKAGFSQRPSSLNGPPSRDPSAQQKLQEHAAALLLMARKTYVSGHICSAINRARASRASFVRSPVVRSPLSFSAVILGLTSSLVTFVHSRSRPTTAVATARPTRAFTGKVAPGLRTRRVIYPSRPRATASLISSLASPVNPALSSLFIFLTLGPYFLLPVAQPELRFL